jgi:hypothetical protein
LARWQADRTWYAEVKVQPPNRANMALQDRFVDNTAEQSR